MAARGENVRNIIKILKKQPIMSWIAFAVSVIALIMKWR